MKHEKEWYTCDRCGCEIGGRYDIPTGSGFTYGYRKIFCKPAELRTITADKSGYVTSERLITPDIVGVDITECYSEKHRTIHLCGKCRKAFERFLRNENI